MVPLLAQSPLLTLDVGSTMMVRSAGYFVLFPAVSGENVPFLLLLQGFLESGNNCFFIIKYCSLCPSITQRQGFLFFGIDFPGGLWPPECILPKIVFGVNGSN